MDGFFPQNARFDGLTTNTHTSDDEQIKIQIAKTDRIRRDAFKIRHDGYLSQNFIRSDGSGLFADDYDDAESTRIVVAYKDDLPVATVRVCCFDPSGQIRGAQKLPAMEIFGPEISTMTGACSPGVVLKTAVEVGRLARHPDYATDKRVIHALFRAVGYLVLFFEADIVLNACRTHHMPFYRRFGFKKLLEPKLYPGLTFEAGLMAVERAQYDEAKGKLSFLQGISKQDSAYAELISGMRFGLTDTQEPFCSFMPVSQGGMLASALG